MNFREILARAVWLEKTTIGKGNILTLIGILAMIVVGTVVDVVKLVVKAALIYTGHPVQLESSFGEKLAWAAVLVLTFAISAGIVSLFERNQPKSSP